MGLFGRPTPPPTPASPAQRPIRVLRADGQRIDLTSRATGLYLAQTRQEWQQRAWDYRDMIGELRYAHRLLARAVARVRFYVAEARPHPEDPAPLDGPDHELDAQLAADAVANFSRLPIDSNPDGFTARLCDNLNVVGEAWVHGMLTDDGAEQWHVRSVSEITANQDRIQLRTLPAATGGGAGGAGIRDINPEREELLRCWVPHSEWAALADSSMRALLDVCEDVVLTGREQRAAARSRVAANGLLLVPDSLSLVKDRIEDADEVDDPEVSDTFLADLIQAMIAPVLQDGDPHGVVPVVLRGAADDLQQVQHVTIDRADSGELMARQSAGLLRLLRGSDIQPEQVEGLGEGNHWSSWVVEASSVKHQVEPMADTVAACLTHAYLRPALRSLGHRDADLSRVVIATDASGLVENINRGQDARDAHDRLVISDEALRLALGFNDDDSPDDEELQRRIASKAGITPEVAAGVLELQRYVQQRQQSITVPSSRDERAGIGPGTDEARPASPGQTVPEQPTPTEPTVTAAAEPDPADGWVVDVDAARRLADIDADLRERILVAADAAVARVIERAGNRVRSKAQGDRELTAALQGVEPHRIAALVGRDRVEGQLALSPQELLADTYTRLRGQVTEWISEAVEAVADAVLAVLRIDPGSQRGQRVRAAVVSRLGTRAEEAWRALTEVLDQAAERALFRPDPFEPETDLPGEQVTTLVRPAEVAGVLAAAGGGRPEQAGGRGLGTGPTVQDLMREEGALLLGHEWQYRPERRRGAPFGPHLALNGTRFGTWTDPKLDTNPATAWIGLYYSPGDHAGCRCSSAPIWAVPEMDDGIVERRLREAREANALAEQVAAEDDAAGRVGTSLQNERDVRRRLQEAATELQRRHIEQGGAA